LQGIRHALGDYYVQVPVKALLGDHQEHDTVKMPFRAARIAAVEETPVEGRLNMQQLKQVTTPQIQARLMRQDYVEFDTTHMTIVSTNHEPGIENADHGSVRRVAAVVWPYRYLKPGLPLVLPTDRTGDPGLRERIAGGQGQHEAALAWMTRGTRQWYQAGQVMPPLPARVRADTDAWIDRVNLMHAFGTAQLAGDTCRWVMSAELYQFFRQVTKDSGNVAWSERTFNARLVEFAASRGWVIEKRKTRHNREALSQPPVDFPAKPPGSYQAWHGLRFRVEADDQAGLDDPDGGHSRDYQ
jgi:phage/plasmid-associated DNA primase